MPKKETRRKNTIEEIPSSVEKKYVSIKEIDSQNPAKKAALWFSVAILSLFVISAWLLLLKTQIRKDYQNLEFLSLARQISESVKNFDKQLESDSFAAIPEDLNELKEGVLEELKQSMDSSFWPTKQLDRLKLSLQIPTDWIINATDVATETTLISSSTGSTIKISLAKNTGGAPLISWTEKNKPEGLKNYTPKEPIFKFTEQSGETLYYDNEKTTTTIDFIYLINSTSTKSVYLIRAFSQEPTEKDRKVIEEIIKTIRILK